LPKELSRLSDRVNDRGIFICPKKEPEISRTYQIRLDPKSGTAENFLALSRNREIDRKMAKYAGLR
jgi:hypothetical protein